MPTELLPTSFPAWLCICPASTLCLGYSVISEVLSGGPEKALSPLHKRQVSSGEESPCEMCRCPWMLQMEPRSQWAAVGTFMDNQRLFCKGKISIHHRNRRNASNLVSTSRNRFWQILPCFLVPMSKSSLCWSPWGWWLVLTVPSSETSKRLCLCQASL